MLSLLHATTYQVSTLKKLGNIYEENSAGFLPARVKKIDRNMPKKELEISGGITLCPRVCATKKEILSIFMILPEIAYDKNVDGSGMACL